MRVKRKNKSTGSTYQWFQRFGLNFTDLLDPTRWEDQENVSKAYTEDITETQFIKRLKVSKTDSRIQSFLKSYYKFWKESDEINET